MANVTTNMGLTKWDDTSDPFSHAQLADNFQLISDHDHTPGKGVQIAYGGLAPQSVGSTQLRNGAVLTAHILDSQVTSNKLANNISGAKIAVDTIGYTKIAKDGSGHPGVFSATGTAFASDSDVDIALGGGGSPTWSEAVDTSSWFSALNGRFTPQVKGVYHFSWSVAFSDFVALGRYNATLYKNGILVRTAGYHGEPPFTVVGSGLLVANGTTDYFQMGYFSTIVTTTVPIFEGFLVARQS